MAAKKKTKKKSTGSKKAKTRKPPQPAKKQPAKKKAAPKKTVAPQKAQAKASKAAPKRAAAGKKAPAKAKKPAPAKIAATKKALAKKPEVKIVNRSMRSRNQQLDSLEPSPQVSGLESGDLEGLSNVESADSESVDELLEEGNAFEAGIVSGVEDSRGREGQELRTREVPEDDVPEEYLNQD
jgi:hypothetical protein